MKQTQINSRRFQFIDVIPAISGLIGKIALVTSFAVVWTAQLGIQNTYFVFENVRLEMIIGSLITLVTALLLPDTAPSGTLAPLIVLIPSMAAFGVHPFILSLFVGCFGLLSIRTGLFQKLLSLSGIISKTSLTLTIGISGILMSVKSLLAFFDGRLVPFLMIITALTMTFLLLNRWKKTWLIIPVGAIIALLISNIFSVKPDLSYSFRLPSFSPDYWWNDMWGIGFGFRFITILKTLPFACFVIILWAVDTVSINTMLEAAYSTEKERLEINLNRSFIITSLRNMMGGLFGGAQTGALWRSYLIPLSMVKRPIYPSSVLMGMLGIIFGFAAIPIKLLSFPPLIWSVLLFGIFLPFVLVGIKNLLVLRSNMKIIFVLCFTIAGIVISPIITWVFAVFYEKFTRKSKT